MFLKKSHWLFSLDDKRSRILVVSSCSILLAGMIFSAHAQADPLSTGAPAYPPSPVIPTFLDILLLVGILVCFLISLRVKSFLKDGELASGWRLFSLSFVLLFVAQFLSLSAEVGFLHISVSVISSLRLLFILSLGGGVYLMKKVLS